MFFLFKWFAKLKHGSEALNDFEEKKLRPKPQRRPKQRIRRRKKWNTSPPLSGLFIAR